MKLNLTIDIAENKKEPKYTRPLTPCEKAQLIIDRIEDPLQDTQTEWEVIKETYKRLQSLKKLSPEMKKLMAIVEETVEKYSSMDPEDGDILQSDSYRRWMDDNDEPIDTLDPPIYSRGKKHDET